MRKISLALAAAAMAGPANATIIFSEDFSSGFGIFTPSGQVSIATGNDYISCCATYGTPANMSDPFVAFGSGNLPSGTITSSSFMMLPGETYTLTFDLGALGVGSETINVSFGGLTTSFTAFGDPSLDTTFDLRTLSVTSLVGGPATVQFTSSGNSNVDGILDNVVLTTTAPPLTAVPEPGTWVMMLLGFGAVGLSIRRTRRARAVPQLA